LLGRKLAERLETGLGRRVVLMSQDAHNQVGDRGFRVVGIFDTQPRQTEEPMCSSPQHGAADAEAGRHHHRSGSDDRDRDRLEPLLARLRARRRVSTSNRGP